MPALVRRHWVVSEVLFDMDGTLVDSIEAVEDAWRALADEEGLDIERMHAFHGRTARDIVTELCPPERHETVLARLNELESAPGQHVRQLSGVDRLLASLPAERWGVVTSATRPVALARIGASGIPTPNVLVTAGDVSRGKPHPEPFQRAQRWATTQIPALAVEDARSGLIAAREAGCLTIAVLGTEDVNELLRRADAVVRSLEDITVAVLEDGSLSVDVTAIASQRTT